MQLHNHSPQQRSLLEQLAAQLAADLVGVSFTDPANDEKTIRYAAYTKGKYDLLVQLIQDSYPDPEPEDHQPVQPILQQATSPESPNF